MLGAETKLKAGKEVVVRYSGRGAGQSSLRLWVDNHGVLHVKALTTDAPTPDSLSVSAPRRLSALFSPVRRDRFVQATPADVWARGAWAGMAFASWAQLPYAIAPVEPIRSDRAPEPLRDFRLRTGVWVRA